MDKWLMPGIPRTIAEDPSMETVRRIRASITSDSGQVVESDLLLDCPFCGGRPWVQVYELDETCVEARVVCSSCHVSTAREYQSWRVWHGDDELTRTLAIGRAISCWNRRAERACHPTHTRERWECDACGCVIRPGFMPEFHGVGALNYCPNCGARVEP